MCCIIVVVVAARWSFSSTTASKLMTLWIYDALQRRDDRGKMRAACRTGKYGRRHGDQLEQVQPAVKSPVPAFASLTRQHSACSSAVQNPSGTRSIEASFGCLVPRAHLPTCASRLISPLQIALSAVAAAAALVRFVQWKRLDESDRDAIWRLYGVFTFAAFVGSVCGVVTWSLYLAADVLYIDALRLGATEPVKSSAELAVSYPLYAAFIVFKSLAFVFVSVAKLMIIDRMT